MALKAISQEQTAVNEFLREFVKEVLRKAQLSNHDGSFDEIYVTSLAEELEKAMGLMVVDALPAALFDEYTRMLYEKKASGQEIGAFLNKNIPDFTAKREKVLTDFAERILRTAKTMKAALETSP